MSNLRDTTVKYVNKDFESYKRDLMRYAQAHFSGAYQDYNESSPGMMILELQAFLADNLAYYMDQQFLEIKQSTARQVENIEEFAKMRGYKPKGLRAARAYLDFIIEVPAVNQSGAYVPDPQYLPVLAAGSQVQGPGSTTFETLTDLDFSLSSGSFLAVASSASNGTPLTFAVRGEVSGVAGQTVVDTIQVTDFTPYLRVQLGNTDVQEVIEMYDAQGFPWYEVDYLAQNMVFDQLVNTGSDQSVVPYVLKMVSAPRRFVVDTVIAQSATFLQFGPGVGLAYSGSFDDTLIPNVAALSLPIRGHVQFTNFILDPQNFLKTSTLGLAPYNTVLTVRYRVGGGVETNVAAGTINKVTQATFEFPNTNGNPQTISNIQNSVEVINLWPSEGGGPAEDGSAIKANADSFFAAQARAVTREDFLTQVLTMPAQFGTVAKAYIKPSDYNPYGVDLHVISLDPSGAFSHPTDTLRSNIASYFDKLRMVTEGITILPANIIDLGVTFGVVISPRFNRSEVLTNCLTTMQAYFTQDRMAIGAPIVISDAEAVLQNINGVISVYKFDVVSFFGTGPSGLPYDQDVNFDVDANTKNAILYCPNDSVFQVKYPNNDIVGESM
jgi:hypothetical protein